LKYVLNTRNVLLRVHIFSMIWITQDNRLLQSLESQHVKK